MIDIKKPVRTKSGLRVINLRIIEFNSNNKRVTFPIKGTIILKEKPFTIDYNVWTMDGKFNPIWNNKTHLDIINVE